MTAAGLFAARPAAVRLAGHRSGVLLDSLYLVAVLSAVVLGGPAQLALAVPVAGIVAMRAIQRRRTAVGVSPWCGRVGRLYRERTRLAP